ncbi:MAG: flavodoxin domain-containing protein [Bacteroidales bacterium]
MKEELYILHGSRTGNSRAAALLAGDYAEHLGIKSRVESMQEFTPKKLERSKNLLIAVSTHGEGDPPFQAETFYNYLNSSGVSGLTDKHFSVLALGDSSYKHFCKTGKDIASRMKELGAKAVYPLVECDIDFEDGARKWVREAVDQFGLKIHPDTEKGKNNKNFAFELRLGDSDDAYFKAAVLEKRLLTGESSTKRIYNLQLDLENSNIEFRSGDSIGILCGNSRLLVDRIIRELDYDPTHPVEIKGKKMLLKHALINEFELTVITPLVVKQYAGHSANQDLVRLMQNKSAFDRYVGTSDIYDLIADFPGKISPEEFVSILRKLTPRLYSVASSEIVTKNRVDLAVGIIEYTEGGREHIGVGSSFIAERLDAGVKIPVVAEPNENFRLPEDVEKPVIMIGTGTGISPFRAFLQERSLTSGAGNWLFFGERSSATDFLYKEDFLNFRKNGVLTRMNTAFSRDQKRRIYVQDLILQHSSEFARWISEGAYIYLCGNKRTMARDVRKTLLEVFRKEGDMNTEQSLAYFEELKREKRFREDVY